MAPSFRYIPNKESPLFKRYLPEMIQLMHRCIQVERDYAHEGDCCDVDSIFPEVFNATALSETMGNYDGGLMVVTLDGVVIGLGCAFFTGDTRAMIGPLFVEDAHRGKGLCSGMLQRFEGILKKRGCTSTALVVLPKNPAQELYKHLGYSQDSVILTKSL